jgi:hypothetical protein
MLDIPLYDSLLIGDKPNGLGCKMFLKHLLSRDKTSIIVTDKELWSIGFRKTFNDSRHRLIKGTTGEL